MADRPDPWEMLETARKWSLRALFLTAGGFFVMVFVVGPLSVFGLNGTLWGLWITILWLTIAVFALANVVHNHVQAIVLLQRSNQDFRALRKRDPAS